MKNGLDHAFRFYDNVLQVRAYRQQLLAANLTNADTPNYKAVDIDFAKALGAAMAGQGDTLPLEASNPRHIQPAAGNPLQGLVRYRQDTQMGLDGNNVDADKEQSAFTENAIQYQAALTFLNGKIKTLLSAIQGS